MESQIQQIGLTFEDEFTQRVQQVAERKWSFRRSTDQENSDHGFDFSLCNIPVDVTLNLPHKSKLSKELLFFNVDNIDIAFAIRYGNVYKTFPHPVLVMGIYSQIG